MKPGRIVLATIIGALVVFAWGAISHMVLPLGEVGIKSLPAEERLVPVLQAELHGRSIYFFPGLETRDANGRMLSADEAQAAMDTWSKKWESGPSGLVVFNPSGSPSMGPLMGVELAGDAIAALILALVLARTSCGFASRVLIALGFGVFAWASIEISYWNWYRFPTDYTIAQLADQAIGWLLSGLAMAGLVGRRARAAVHPESAAITASHT